MGLIDAGIFLKLQRTLSIRANLAILVAVCLLPAMVAAAGILVYHYQQQRAQLISETVSSARTLKKTVDSEFATAQTALEVLATSPHLKNQNFSAFHAQASEVIALSFINNIALVAPGGQQLVNTARPYGEILPKSALGEQVNRVLTGGQSEVSGLLVGAVLKRPLLSMTVPVRMGQTVSYVLSGVVLPAQLQKIINNSSQPRDRFVVIFDKSGIIGARSHEPGRFVGKSVAPGLAARLKEVNEDAFEVRTLEGVPVVSVFSRSEVTGWGVAIGIPTQTLTAGLRYSMWQLATLTALLLCLGLATAWWMGGRISRAIDKLMQPAIDLAQGRTVKVPGLAFKEAEALGGALIQTSKVLETTTNALKSSEIRLRSILQSAMDAIITVDDAQTVVLFNSAAAVMFACPAEQALGQSVTQFIPSRFHSEYFDYVQKNRSASDGAEVFGIVGNAIGRRSQGDEFPLEVSYSNVTAPDGIFHTLIIRDITSRVQAFKALERSNLDLQQFAYVASHDLKTPLRSISGFVQILERNHADKLDDDALVLIRRTALAAKRLEQLTDDMLSFARVNSDPSPFVRVDSAEVVEEAIHLLDAVIKSTSAVVTVGDLPCVMGDWTQLVQLFLNLMGNGLKYCQGCAPVLHVSALVENNEWVFSVKDNGIGIDAKHHRKIFEIFKRLHTQTEYAGTGIGLAVCHRIVERHHGKIWVESSVGEGSTFRFTLPIDSEPTP